MAPPGRYGNRANSGVAVQDVFFGQLHAFEERVDLIEQVSDFLVGGLDSIQVTVVAEVGTAEQHHAVPGQNENRSTIGSGLVVNRFVRSAIPTLDDDVTAFGTADEPLADRPLAGTGQYPIYPRASHINDDPTVEMVGLSAEVVDDFHPAYDSAFRDNAGHRCLRDDLRTVLKRGESVLYNQAFGECHLGVEIDR